MAYVFGLFYLAVVWCGAAYIATVAKEAGHQGSCLAAGIIGTVVVCGMVAICRCNDK